MNKRVLKLDIGGRPVSWITREEGALMYCRDQVAWEAGMEHIVLRGGYMRTTGTRSILFVSTIVATRGVHREIDLLNDVPALTNRRLFRRDSNMCLYCGDFLYDYELTRDHVVRWNVGARTWRGARRRPGAGPAGGPGAPGPCRRGRSRG